MAHLLCMPVRCRFPGLFPPALNLLRGGRTAVTLSSVTGNRHLRCFLRAVFAAFALRGVLLPGLVSGSGFLIRLAARVSVLTCFWLQAVFRFVFFRLAGCGVAVGTPEQSPDSNPCKVLPGVGFALWCNVAVSRPVAYGVVLRNGRQQGIQDFVLCGGKCFAFTAFEFYADGKIVAVIPPLPM